MAVNLPFMSLKFSIVIFTKPSHENISENVITFDPIKILTH